MSATILQLIALGLFTTLMSNQLGLVKKIFIIKLLIIFDLKKILTTLFISLALFAYLIFKIFQGEISNIYYIFYTFYVLVCLRFNLSLAVYLFLY